MKELQKSHVLKVEELSRRRKLTEDFDEVTSFFLGSNVKTVYFFGDNGTKYPDAEIDDEHTRNSLASPLYIQEREASASLLQVYHSQKRKLVSRCTVNFSKYGRPVNWMSQKRKFDQELDNCQFRIILEREKEQLPAEAKSEILRHEYRADLAENKTCELKKQIDSQIEHTRTRYEQSRREQAPLHTGKIQELQNEINCMNDSRDFQDAESVRSGHSHVTSRPVSFPPHPVPGGILSRSLGMSSRREGPPSIWDTHGISGNVFANPVASSTAPCPQELNPWSSGISEPIHSPTAEKGEKQTPDQDLRCQSGPSAKDSVIFSGGDSSKNYGANQQRLQISELHFDKFHTPATFACWKTRFETEVCTCSQFPTEAMLRIKEVEMIESVDDLKSSRSIKGTHGPDFELLDARIASALNKIIQNTRFKKKVSLEEMKAQKRRPLPPRKTDCLPDL